ncbi:hypothetical protein SAMN03080594_10444 [Arenibacter palladensis]|uniref:Lipocalin-like domain-containing protein n=1 Tax=Arenibacter palladensis TaxID=237373 RepID=A0A1M5BG47_9FLAO|nr:hypothetical protein [Arenibacter palladensis]SHF41419.1 hypothetical protein SAMN03080594_10444 [Arenibacter palladensis]|tara:strand:+ start:8937 stop:9311 length:375 start_codon:yes stop_codon:yes gene_type:complete
MKKLFSFLAIIGILLASNCTRITENNDPVIGIWSHIATDGGTTQKQDVTVRQEWIFNDAYLGRYHTYHDKNLTVISDFKWVHKDSLYVISYPGLDKEEDIVIMTESDNGTVLADADGNVLAIRE